MSNLIREARIFMIAAHEAVQQKRKYSGEPYWKHPQTVALYVQQASYRTEEMIAAALLHDVVEDTGVNIETIYDLFGETVAKYVNGLTDVSKPEDGNREFRKALDRSWISIQCPEVKTIKLADLIHNSESILHHDRDFAKVYILEKEKLLTVLTEGDKVLWDNAKSIVDDAKTELRIG